MVHLRSILVDFHAVLLKMLISWLMKLSLMKPRRINDSWYRKMLCIGGDTYPESASNAYQLEFLESSQMLRMLGMKMLD